MFETVSHFFNVLAFLDLTLAILCCILLIKVSSKYAIKFVTIPMILLTSYVLIIEGGNMLGRPYEIMPVGKFEFLDYRVDTRKGEKKIELWVLQDKKSRLHIIDYDEKYEHELAKAKSRKNKGVRGQGEFIPDDNKTGRDNLSIAEMPTEQFMPPKEEAVQEGAGITAIPESDIEDKWK